MQAHHITTNYEFGDGGFELSAERYSDGTLVVYIGDQELGGKDVRELRDLLTQILDEGEGE